MRLRLRYLIVAAVVFGLLAAIETQLESGFIRHSVGDSLAVVLVYAILMTFSTWSRIVCAGVSLAIAYLVEISQAIDVIDRLGITPNRFTNVVFGNTFTWGDIVAYTAGIAVALAIEALTSSLFDD